MKPYYEDNKWVKIYHGDCREVLPELSGLQLLATSPPYNVGLDYDVYYDTIPWPQWYQMIREFLAAAYSSLRPGGILALNMPLVANQGELVKRSRRERKIISRGEPIFARVTIQVGEQGFLLREPLIWAKSPNEGTAYAAGCGIGSANNPYLRMAAEAFILASKEHYHMLGGTGKRGSQFSRPMDWCKNIWHIRPGWQDGKLNGKHPAPWPWTLCDRLLLMFSNPGDITCDPFMGTGKFLLRAKLNGRYAIGIEISERYCEMAAKLCSQGVMETIRTGELAKSFGKW